MQSTRRLALRAIGLAGAIPATARAQALAGTPITLLVPQPAGNPTDALARRLQPSAQRELGQPLIVENLPGAGGALGVNKVLAQPAGALAMVITSQTEAILTPLSVRAARYGSDSLRPILLVTRGPYVLVARSDLPARDFGELIALARQRSAQPLGYGHIGHGSMIHLLGERLARLTGITLNHVPYKGVPPLMQDVVGGQIDLSFVPQSSARELAAAGRIKVLGTTAATASPRMPDARPISAADPALADFVHGTWGAVFVSRQMPEDEVRRLHRALTIACHEPTFQAQTLATGSDPAPAMTLAELERFYEGEVKLYQAIAREVGVKPE